MNKLLIQLTSTSELVSTSHNSPPVGISEGGNVTVSMDSNDGFLDHFTEIVGDPDVNWDDEDLDLVGDL